MRIESSLERPFEVQARLGRYGWLGLAGILFVLLTGCGRSKVGLQPVRPPFKIGTFSTQGYFVAVDSLQPTLQWQSFPRSQDRPDKPEGIVGVVEEVTYELRIWETRGETGGHLAYQREGLREPLHTLEQPLRPESKYFWSVRARFKLNGRTRVTEWGGAGFLKREATVPNISCFRFITPRSDSGGKLETGKEK